MDKVQTNIQKLKEVIWKANPSILELKFGCEVECRIDALGEPNEAGLEYDPAIEKTVYVTHDDYLEAGHHFGDILVEDVIDGYLGEDYDGIHCKILGRPIRLADVLLAINAMPSHPECLSLNSDAKIMLDIWNLRDDNLDHQSSETKQFLIDLFV